MLAYVRAYDAGRLVLVYPWHERMGRRQEVHRRWFVTGTHCRFGVATVDVGRPGEVVKVLRGICECEPACVHPSRFGAASRTVPEPRNVAEQ